MKPYKLVFLVLIVALLAGCALNPSAPPPGSTTYTPTPAVKPTAKAPPTAVPGQPTPAATPGARVAGGATPPAVSGEEAAPKIVEGDGHHSWKLTKGTYDTKYDAIVAAFKVYGGKKFADSGLSGEDAFWAILLLNEPDPQTGMSASSWPEGKKIFFPKSNEEIQACVNWIAQRIKCGKTDTWWQGWGRTACNVLNMRGGTGVDITNRPEFHVHPTIEVNPGVPVL